MTTPAFLEAASENISKPKRGRPSKLTADELFTARMYWPDLSDRQQREHAYMVAGLALLTDDNGKLPARYKWLCDGARVRVGILAMLGRMYTDDEADIDDIRHLAGALCEQKPKTKDALQFLRQSVGRIRTKEADDGDLAHVLAVAIDNWRAKYPTVTDGDVANALERLLAVFQPPKKKTAAADCE